MKGLAKFRSLALKRSGRVALLLMVSVGVVFAQKSPPPTRIWVVGPLTKSAPVASIALGAEGPTVTAPDVDSQTGSTFAATRSVVFAGDRIVLASMVGMRKVEGSQVPEQVYRVISLDAQTGEVKDTREIASFASLLVFATNDGRVIVSAKRILRFTSDLKDDGSLEGQTENVSPDGFTLGRATRPGFGLVDLGTLKATQLTEAGVYETSVSTKGFVTDDLYWTRDYPKDLNFVTFIDATGQHLLYHSKCGGRPQFLSDDLILEPGCKYPFILDIHRNVVRTLSVTGKYSYAGVSQNSKRLALQTAHSTKQDRFVIYSVDTGEPLTEVTSQQISEKQLWTAFSPDGSMFVVGSPLKLTLYRLP